MIRNEADVVVQITAEMGPCIPPCGSPPNLTFAYAGGGVPNPNTGAFIYIGAPGKDQVFLNMRVFDRSRADSIWGTALPVVTERDVHATAFHLLNVPLSDSFRTSLRIYDFDGQDAAQIRLRVFSLNLQNATFDILRVDRIVQLLPIHPVARDPNTQANLQRFSSGTSWLHFRSWHL